MGDVAEGYSYYIFSNYRYFMKNLKKGYFDQCLVCAALKHWSAGLNVRKTDVNFGQLSIFNYCGCDDLLQKVKNLQLLINIAQV